MGRERVYPPPPLRSSPLSQGDKVGDDGEEIYFSQQSPLHAHRSPLFWQGLDEEHFQIVSGAIEHIAIHRATDAGELAAIGVLPEVPLDVLRWLGDIVVCHPEGVFFELLIRKHIAAETITAIYNRFHAIVLLHLPEPLESHVLNLLFVLARSKPFALVLDVEHGWQVALFEMCLTKEKLRLFLGRDIGS